MSGRPQSFTAGDVGDDDAPRASLRQSASTQSTPAGRARSASLPTLDLLTPAFLTVGMLLAVLGRAGYRAERSLREPGIVRVHAETPSEIV